MRYGAKVDEAQRELVPVYEQFGASWQSTASVGHDCPDGFVGFLGLTDPIEFKTGKAKVTAGQLEWHISWRGSPVRVIRTRADVVEHLDDMRRRSRALRRAG